MYVRPSVVNTGGGAMTSGAAFSISMWLGIIVAIFTITFAVIALIKIMPKVTWRDSNGG